LTERVEEGCGGPTRSAQPCRRRVGVGAWAVEALEYLDRRRFGGWRRLPNAGTVRRDPAWAADLSVIEFQTGCGG